MTYFDFNFISYAAMSLSSFIETNHFDSLTIILPGSDDSQESRILAGVAAMHAQIDSRIIIMQVDDILGFSERENNNLRTGHPQLFTDILRSSLFRAFGEPVVWFDTDMLFLTDISSLLNSANSVALAAAPDMVSSDTASVGAQIYRAFIEHVNRCGDDIHFGNIPVNCGLLVLRADLEEKFHKGLGYAIGLLEDSQTTSRLSQEQLSILRHTLGQLAWNYVFYSSESQILSSNYNWYPGDQPLGHWLRDPALTPKVLHYIGMIKQWRMAVEYARLFGSYAISSETSTLPNELQDSPHHGA